MNMWQPVCIVRFTELDTVALNQVPFLQFFNVYIHLRIYIYQLKWMKILYYTLYGQKYQADKYKDSS